MGAYRSRRIWASICEHLVDGLIGTGIGAIGAVLLYLVTLAVVAQLGVSI